MSKDWRSTLNFTDRVANLTRIEVALLSAGLASSTQDAQARARVSESEAYRSASSKDVYMSLAARHIQEATRTSFDGTSFEEAEREHALDDLVAGSGGISIGKYSGAKEHANGVFSTVYQATSLEVSDGAVKQLVALKVTHPSSMQPPHDSKREARILSAAASQNVLPLLGTFVTKDTDFVLIFPFLKCDLSQILRSGPLAPRRAKPILTDLMRALSHIHSLGIIHRDIKPSNILMRDGISPAILADFGIAWMPGDPTSEPADDKILDVSTTSYRPPELLFGNQKYDESLDMWSAGCVAAQVMGLGPRTLFDSGDLGSELALIKSIFSTLGTPDLTMWPVCISFDLP